MRNHFGTLLADNMGLGKTLQVIIVLLLAEFGFAEQHFHWQFRDFPTQQRHRRQAITSHVQYARPLRSIRNPTLQPDFKIRCQFSMSSRNR